MASLTRFSLFRSSAVRSLHTSASFAQSARVNPPTSSESAALDPPPASGPKAFAHVAPADVVAGKVVGPETIHETPQEIAAEVISGAPSTFLTKHLAVEERVC